MAHSEFIDVEVADGNLNTFDNGSNHFWLSEVEALIAELAPESPSVSD